MCWLKKYEKVDLNGKNKSQEKRARIVIYIFSKQYAIYQLGIADYVVVGIILGIGFFLVSYAIKKQRELRKLKTTRVS